MKNGKNGKDRLDRIEETLRMASVHIADLAKNATRHDREMAEMRAEFRESFRKSRAEHDKDMKEIRALLKQMIRRIAA